VEREVAGRQESGPLRVYSERHPTSKDYERRGRAEETMVPGSESIQKRRRKRREVKHLSTSTRRARARRRVVVNEKGKGERTQGVQGSEDTPLEESRTTYRG